MKAKTMSRLALLCAVLALIVSLLTLFRPTTDDSSDELEQLRQQTAELQSIVDDLRDQLGSMSASATLQEWTFRIAPRADASGAEITLVATPETYEDDMAAEFIIRLNGQEVATQGCIWDGDTFVGSVDLDAADGYSYYCVLVAANGSRQQYPLTTVENPVDDLPVNLATSLSSSCTLVVEAFEVSGETMTLTAGSLQAQLPQLSGDDVSILSADLVLSTADGAYSRTAVTLDAGDRYGSYILDLTDLALTLPELEDGDQLNLTLEVSLSNGNTLRSADAEWKMTDGTLTAE